MAYLDPIIVREIPFIQKIIRDETWFEGERRGCEVSPDDPVVQENACHVVLRIGGEFWMRCSWRKSRPNRVRPAY
jgi:hypothetical protein